MAPSPSYRRDLPQKTYGALAPKHFFPKPDEDGGCSWRFLKHKCSDCDSSVGIDEY